MLSLRELQRIFGGEISNGELHCAGPGHSRADRSLSLRPVEDGPNDLGLMYHSFADDDPTAIEDFLREKLNTPKPKPNGNGRQRLSEDALADMVARAAMAQGNGRARGKLVATYDYTDQHGVLLYQVLRYDPKSFSQRRPDGNGGWIWKLGDVQRVPYRWPELLKYPDATAFICEGEKDADRVASLNHCATTVAHGEWTNDCVQALAGRDVIVLQDNDAAGRKKALKAATVLHGVTKTVRIVSLPGLAEGEDVSDWLDLSRWNTIDKLIELCFSTPPWTPSPSTRHRQSRHQIHRRRRHRSCGSAPASRKFQTIGAMMMSRRSAPSRSGQKSCHHCRHYSGSICLVGTMNRGPNANGSF